MKFHLERPDGQNRFTGYGAGYVEVNGERISGPVVVAGDWLERDAQAAALARLDVQALAGLAGRRPEVVLLGTGSALRFPPRGALAPLQAAGIGVEVMDTPAACRTFNILRGEGRHVIAALVVD